MSFQHRSKISSVIDYIELPNDMGICCYPFSEAPEYAQYSECVNGNGYFHPVDWDLYDGNVNDLLGLIGSWGTDDPAGDINGDGIVDSADLAALLAAIGHDWLGDVNCPDLGTLSCCCACNYVDSYEEYFASFEYGPSRYRGGIKEEVTSCECNDLGGVWAGVDASGEGISCPTATEGIYSLCTNDTNEVLDDVRMPGACCHDDNTQCDNVCSPEECGLLDEDGQYRLFEICGSGPEGWGGPNPADCGDPYYKSMGQRDRNANVVVVDRKITKKDRIEAHKNKITMKDNNTCCVYKNNENEIECGQFTNRECKIQEGLWAGFDVNGESLSCDSSACEIHRNLLENEGRIDSSYIDSWITGKYVFGGRYVGVFYSQSDTFGNGSICFGNRKTGRAKEYMSNTTEKCGLGFGETKYAVIIANRDVISAIDYKNGLTNLSIEEGSWSDTLWNKKTFKDTYIQRKLSLIDNSYVRWTVPSLDVLAFLQNNITTDEFRINTNITTFPSDRYHTMRNKYYWSSTPYNIGKKPYYFYTQFFNTNKYESFVSINKSNKKMSVRPVCMIPIKY
jgi:hypothetical protein